jgi:hypothetical protein
MKTLLQTLALLVCGLDATAGIYKCLDAGGTPVYSDTPCSPTAQVISIDAPSPPADGRGGLRSGEIEMLKRAYANDERERERRERAARSYAGSVRLERLEKRKDELARELRSSIGSGADRRALSEEMRSIDREMGTLRQRR